MMSQNDTIDDHAAQLVIFFTIGEKRKYLPSSALELLIPKARREKAVITVLVICMLGYNIYNELAPCVFVFM